MRNWKAVTIRVVLTMSLSFLIVAQAIPPFPRPAIAKRIAMPRSCNAAVQILPGDGAGVGPALNYVDNMDGTFTDCNTKFMWEKKLAADGSDGGNCDEAELKDRNVHCVNNGYTWSTNVLDPNGTLFTEFLAELNNSGFAGYSDWCIPDIRVLSSIVDYGRINPTSTSPGPVAGALYWSVTTFPDGASVFNEAWGLSFGQGLVTGVFKPNAQPARAVRPCL